MRKIYSLPEIQIFLKNTEDEIEKILLAKSNAGLEMFTQNFQNIAMKALKHINYFVNLTNMNEGIGKTIDGIIKNLEGSVQDYRSRNINIHEPHLKSLNLSSKEDIQEEQQDDQIYHFMNSRNRNISAECLSHLSSHEVEKQRNQLFLFVQEIETKSKADRPQKEFKRSFLIQNQKKKTFLQRKTTFDPELLFIEEEEEHQKHQTQSQSRQDERNSLSYHVQTQTQLTNISEIPQPFEENPNKIESSITNILQVPTVEEEITPLPLIGHQSEHIQTKNSKKKNQKKIQNPKSSSKLQKKSSIKTTTMKQRSKNNTIDQSRSQINRSNNNTPLLSKVVSEIKLDAEQKKQQEQNIQFTLIPGTISLKLIPEQKLKLDSNVVNVQYIFDKEIKIKVHYAHSLDQNKQSLYFAHQTNQDEADKEAIQIKLPKQNQELFTSFRVLHQKQEQRIERNSIQKENKEQIVERFESQRPYEHSFSLRNDKRNSSFSKILRKASRIQSFESMESYEQNLKSHLMNLSLKENHQKIYSENVSLVEAIPKFNVKVTPKEIIPRQSKIVLSNFSPLKSMQNTLEQGLNKKYSDQKQGTEKISEQSLSKNQQIEEGIHKKLTKDNINAPQNQLKLHEIKSSEKEQKQQIQHHNFTKKIFSQTFDVFEERNKVKHKDQFTENTKLPTKTYHTSFRMSKKRNNSDQLMTIQRQQVSSKKLQIPSFFENKKLKVASITPLIQVQKILNEKSKQYQKFQAKNNLNYKTGKQNELKSIDELQQHIRSINQSIAESASSHDQQKIKMSPKSYHLNSSSFSVDKLKDKKSFQKGNLKSVHEHQPTGHKLQKYELNEVKSNEQRDMAKVLKLLKEKHHKQQIKQYIQLLEFTHQRYCGGKCKHVTQFYNSLEINATKEDTMAQQILRLAKPQ